MAGIESAIPDRRRLYKKGDRIVCDGGHYIATVAKDLYTWDILDNSMFDDLQGEPIGHLTFCGCCVCGELWAAYGYLRTESGWGWHSRPTGDKMQQLKEDWARHHGYPYMRHGHSNLLNAKALPGPSMQGSCQG